MKYFILFIILAIPLVSFAQNEDIIVEVPKVLSINGEVNNVFKITSSNVNYEVIHFKIFSRWGNEIYTSKSNDAKWYGTEKNNNKYVPSGTYYYSIKLRLANREKKELTGYITVIE